MRVHLPTNKKLPKKPNIKPAKKKPKPKPKPKSKPKPKPKKGSDRFGAHHGFKGISKSGTERLAQSVINKEIRDLNNQKADVDRDYKTQQAESSALYERGKGDLNYVNQEVTGFLGDIQNKNAAMYQGERSKQAAAAAALKQSLGDTYSGAASGASEELARLGIQGGGNLSQLHSDAANAQAVAAQSGQNALSSMDLAAGNAAQMNNLLQGMAAGSHTSHIGRNLNAWNDRSMQNTTQRNDQITKVNQALRDTNQSRNDIYLQLLQSLQQTRWGQFVDAQDLKLRRRKK